MPFDDNSEQIWCKVTLKTKQTVYICSFYKPPNVLDLTPLYNSIRHFVVGNSGLNEHKIIFGGDFNCPDINWLSYYDAEANNSKSLTYSNTSKALIEVMETFNFKQHVLKPTRITSTCSNTLDLCFSNLYDFNVNVNVVPGLSDHCAVLCRFAIEPSKQPLVERSIWLFKKANWNQIKADIANSFNLFQNEFANRTADENWLSIKNIILNSMEANIPRKLLKRQNRQPYFNNKLKILLRKQRILHANAKKFNTDEHWRIFRAARSESSSLRKQLFNDYIQAAVNDGGHSKTFWRFIKSKRRECGIPSLRGESGELVIDPKTKGNMFNSFFRSVFKKDCQNSQLSPQEQLVIEDEMPSIHVEPEGIRKLLLAINETKSAGPDKIPGRVIKKMATELCVFLQLLFQQILDNGEIPSDWKTAFVSPIFKSGDKHQCKNYRPISLTCIVSRIFEHILHSAVSKHLHKNGILSPSQHGFTQGLSCETQLVSLYHDLAIANGSKKGSNPQHRISATGKCIKIRSLIMRNISTVDKIDATTMILVLRVWRKKRAKCFL